MKFAGSCSIVAMLMLLLLPEGAQSQDIAIADKPYASIIARNMFGLLPIPPPDTNPPAPPVDPPPKITLNGIMTIFGRDQALFKVATKPAPGQPAKDNSYVLSEGERQDEIEVVKINHVDGIVSFNNHGTSQELPLLAAANGSGAAAGPGGAPGPGNPASGFPRLGSPRRPGMNVGAPNYNNNVGSPAQPNMNPGGSPYQAAGTQPSGQSIEDRALSAARTMAEIEDNRIATQELVNKGLMPPLPPTPMTPPDATAADGYPLVVPTEGGKTTPVPSNPSGSHSSTPLYPRGN
jgi:hypothetical protein